jgi:hypothetical protein
VPLALTGDEYLVLASAVVPVVAAAGIVWAAWRWAKRDEAREAAARESADSRDRL